ncbi:unnamed protein product [Aspergillus oryzae]|nr:unnamed protein product [Aspergillus oryzae]GMF88088.1 unnamed protein product [Aspergillus oryzae]
MRFKLWSFVLFATYALADECRFDNRFTKCYREGNGPWCGAKIQLEAKGRPGYTFMITTQNEDLEDIKGIVSKDCYKTYGTKCWLGGHKNLWCLPMV